MGNSSVIKEWAEGDMFSNLIALRSLNYLPGVSRTRVVTIGVAAIIPTGKTVPRVACAWGVYLCVRLSNRGRAVRGSACLGCLLHGPHLCSLFSSWSTPCAQPLTAQDNTGASMSLLPGVFYNPPQEGVPCWCEARQQCEGKGLRGGLGKGLPELPRPQRVDGIGIKGFSRCC